MFASTIDSSILIKKIAQRLNCW